MENDSLKSLLRQHPPPWTFGAGSWKHIKDANRAIVKDDASMKAICALVNQRPLVQRLMLEANGIIELKAALAAFDSQTKESK